MLAVMYVCLFGVSICVLIFSVSEYFCVRLCVHAFRASNLVYARMFVFVGMSLHDVILCSFRV